MLEVKNLHASVFDKPILKGLNLTIGAGEVHAIMGPNGSGKSTLTNVIAGRPGYQIDSGSILYQGQDIGDLEVEERAGEGIFLALQYPVEIPGISNMMMLRTALNSLRKYRGETEIAAGDFIKQVKEKSALLEIDDSFLKRAVNVGFSGGEKKRNEVLQMTMIAPMLALLDETDSGLDIDAMKVIAKGVNSLRDASRSMVLVTHYQRLLNYIEPDVVHVLWDGRIAETGDKSLAQKLEQEGYGWIRDRDPVTT